MKLITTVFAMMMFTYSALAKDIKLTTTGSSTIAPLMLEIAKLYEKEHPSYRIDVQSGGSSKGVADTRDKSADFGMASRAAKSTERDLDFHTIALDGIAIIVHASNPMTQITSDQVVKIYNGEVDNWMAFDGKNQAIVVVNKAEGRSTLELFLDHFKLKASQVKAHSIIGDNEQGIKTVAGNPRAIGYVSIGSAEVAVASGVKIKMLKLDGLTPSQKALQKAEYPLMRPLNLVTTKKPSKEVLEIIRFAQSPKVKKIVEAQAFVFPK